MARATAKPVTPDQRIRDLRKEFRGFDREEPGPDRAARLAGFTRAAHDERQLNMAMHTATLCLADDPDAPDLLVAAYAEADETLEERMYALSDLRDLGRYIDRADIESTAGSLLRACAEAFVAEADPSEQRYRLRTVQSAISREVADEIRDALRAEG